MSVAAALTVEDGTITDARVALGGVAHVPWRASAAERALIGAPATEETFRAAAAAELDGARPVDSPRGGTAFKIPLVTATLVATLRGLVAKETA